jgi:hypothetical protein
MRDMVARRDAQLVELAAARLNGDLVERVLALQTLLAPTRDGVEPLSYEALCDRFGFASPV